MVPIFIRSIEAARDNEKPNRRKSGGGDCSLIISITTLKHKLFFSVIWFTYRKDSSFWQRYSHAISNTNKICNISITAKYLVFFLCSQFLFPTPMSFATTYLICVPKVLLFQEYLYKWNHAMRSILCLASLT